MLLARLPRLLTSTTSTSLPSSYQLLRCPLPTVSVHPCGRGSTSAPDRPTEGLWDRWLGPQAGIARKGDGTNR